MLKKMFRLLGAAALFAGLAAEASAQQLYVSDIQVKYSTVAPSGSATPSNGYCNDVDDNSPNVSYLTDSGNVWNTSSLIEFERPRPGFYPGGCLALCAKLTCVSTAGYFGVDELTFEVFKFGAGSNPLDPASTPPIKTVSMYDIGTCNSSNNVPENILNKAGGSYFCTAWDGSYNLNGIFGKTNGQFGFRAKVKTNQVSATAGNISIEQTAAFPGQNQIPIQINVTNIHTVRSSPTVVGKITGVAAQPYNILYRLSKDATVTINVYDANIGGTLPLVRTIIAGAPRVGEGIPDGTLTNGDFWDGRDSHGDLVPGGNYLVRIEAGSNDNWQPPTDLAWPATIQMSLDPLQVTDVAIKPLGASSTDLATISYQLTEAATVYVEVYTPGTVFTDVNTAPISVSGGSGTLLRRFVEQKEGRKTVTTYWDGRDNGGNIVCDGNYVYAIYAVLPGAGGSVWTRKTLVGTVPVARGPVIAFLAPSSTVIGSSPAVAGLDPFYFRYTPSRDTYVSLNIRDMGNNLVRRVTTREVRFANFSNREIWDGKRDDGTYVSSGAYIAELVTEDPFQCSVVKTSTMTVEFPVNMFRVTDVKATPLLGGASDVATISFELSQPMYVELSVYYTTVTIVPSQVWPDGGNPSLSVLPSETAYSVQGMRPGRYKITEYWDGRDNSGMLVPDGRYPFALVAHTTSPVTTAQTMYATDKVYGYVDVARGQIIFTMFDVTPTIPTMYNSSDTIKLPPYEVDYSVTRQSSVTVQIMTMTSPSKVIANVISGQIRDGDIVYRDFWDGKDDSGNFVDGGAYNVRVTAQDIASQLASYATVQMTIDVYPLRIYDVSITPLTLDGPAVVSYQVSEPMKVVTKVYKPGTMVNSAGTVLNEDRALVKRIIGVRPARTKVEEYWDGTDLTMSKVPDGNYVFKIYASTVTDSISTIDGSVALGTKMADDIVVSNIPVTKGGTADLCGDFAKDSFFAPNPYSGEAGWFRIPVLMNGRVTLAIYNIAGDLVYKRDYGVKGGGDDIDGAGKCVASHTSEACWPRVNSSGRTVAPGVYFAVLRFEASEGTRDVCQTVKKILVP